MGPDNQNNTNQFATDFQLLSWDYNQENSLIIQ